MEYITYQYEVDKSVCYLRRHVSFSPPYFSDWFDVWLCSANFPMDEKNNNKKKGIKCCNVIFLFALLSAVRLRVITVHLCSLLKMQNTCRQILVSVHTGESLTLSMCMLPCGNDLNITCVSRFWMSDTIEDCENELSLNWLLKPLMTEWNC